MFTFAQRLRVASDTARSLLCVGLDPVPDRLPVASVADFNRAVVSATADLVCAYKPNLAFYEALGLVGWRALDATVRHIREVAPHAVIIGDGKRGDIDSSAAAYVRAMFVVWDFDAATINPWGGLDTLEPWLANSERGAFIWCRGSNPGATDIQDRAACEPLYLELARWCQERSAPGNLGVVVGATAPDELSAVRAVAPDLPILIPGVGPQGGDLSESVRRGVDASGRMAIVNASRSVVYASTGADYAASARRTASRLRDEINAILYDMGRGWPAP